MKFLKLLFIIPLFFTFSHLNGQAPLEKSNALPELGIEKILNSTESITTSTNLPGPLTIIDFFGTWCVPCLRALPNLAAIQNEFNKQVSIFLVSDEGEEKLTNFISARKPFPFPIIIDKDGKWNAAFAPPALPYTVVLKQGVVVAVTEAEAITADSIRNWLKAKSPVAKIPLSAETKAVTTGPMQNTFSNNKLVKLSQEFIYAAKTGEPIDVFLQQLNALSFSRLTAALPTDNAKKAFWINLYNGYTSAALSKAPELYQDRNAFFKAKSIPVAGTLYSLDDIEHGILRHSKIKWSLGHFTNPFPGKREKTLRVDTLDYRIHFALNCGAKSCPPIAFYNDETLEVQLEKATKVYLSGEAEFNPAANEVWVPQLMSWFRADFGGKRGIQAILQRHGIVPAGVKPKIKFKEYDWTLTLDNYAQQKP